MTARKMVEAGSNGSRGGTAAVRPVGASAVGASGAPAGQIPECGAARGGGEVVEDEAVDAGHGDEGDNAHQAPAAGGEEGIDLVDPGDETGLSAPKGGGRGGHRGGRRRRGSARPGARHGHAVAESGPAASGDEGVDMGSPRSAEAMREPRVPSPISEARRHIVTSDFGADRASRWDGTGLSPARDSRQTSLRRISVHRSGRGAPLPQKRRRSVMQRTKTARRGGTRP